MRRAMMAAALALAGALPGQWADSMKLRQTGFWPDAIGTLTYPRERAAVPYSLPIPGQSCDRMVECSTPTELVAVGWFIG